MNTPVPIAPGLESPPRGWRRLGLTRQYALASLPVLLAGMLGLGAWVTSAIEKQVIQNSAVNASLYVNSFVSPVLQGLKDRARVSEDEIKALESLLADTQLGRRIKSFKVWKPQGRIAYYTRRALIGQVFEPTQNQLDVWAGEVRAELSALSDEEDSAERGLGIPLLEVYMPVRERDTGRVIAVAEFYQDARVLEEQLTGTRRDTWLAVAAVTLTMWGALFGIVHAGGALIRRQALELRRRIAELSQLLEQNEALRRRVGRATRRVAELNEHAQRRLSADLHDGPAQALSLALLRLDTLATPAAKDAGDAESLPAPDARDAEFESIREGLREALDEIRQICRGLSLPELAGLTLASTLERAAVSHRRRTHSEVAVQCQGLDDTAAVAMPIKITAYRVTQEALMNAFRHAGGRGQRVEAAREGRWLRLVIADTGPGLGSAPDDERTDRLGLRGIRERVESLGGRFDVEAEPGQGTRVSVSLPLEDVS